MPLGMATTENASCKTNFEYVFLPVTPTFFVFYTCCYLFLTFEIKLFIIVTLHT